MTRKFLVNCVLKSSLNYFEELEKYVGQILEVNTQGASYPTSIALFIPDKTDYFYFDYDWLTEVTDSTKKESPLDKQVSGTHYKDCGIQPIEYIHANGLNYFEGNVIKYTTRHAKKNGKADIEKAIHYLEMILELQYKDK